MREGVYPSDDRGCMAGRGREAYEAKKTTWYYPGYSTPTTDSEARKKEELEQLLAEFENDFPGFTRAVMEITQHDR